MKITIRSCNERSVEILFDGKKVERLLSYSIECRGGAPVVRLEIDAPDLEVSLRREVKSDDTYFSSESGFYQRRHSDTDDTEYPLV